ncbi:HelD family protein [Streptomyces caeruleatus]|uniref:AAA family ATPase n=1 Tax=Streptomyces caeruleatus TaxID=661399 RepID=A0A117RJX8_9ACTN|nr:AAA family ATPase [Streptomyces caeruleatus]KUN94936.1 AAA family ATPase [Streptomyces caeruleatus]
MTSPDPALRQHGLSQQSLHHALHQERAHHDRCRTALAAMVDGADEQVVVGENASASGADAEVLGYRLRSQAKAMHELPEGPLFFGRLDFGGQERQQALHIGRLRISEHPAEPPLVVDWRAPVSRAFYQAGPRDPQGVAVRRRFGWAPGSRGDSADLTGLEDEHLGTGETGTGESGAGESGTGESGASEIVAREIERPRVGPMRDIAATIQPEQDDLVRGDLALSVCVQGAPGTGKTAVGLHRAAYLLYTHPQRIRRGGLLILGPNPTFLSYISEVLPALGETGVRQSTLRDEIARHPVKGADDERAAVVKHDARMAEVLRRALYARVGGGEGIGPLAVPEGSYRWRVAEGELLRIVAGVRAEEPPYAVGRERVRTRVVRRILEQAERRGGPPGAAWLQKISRARAVGEYVDAVWPRVRPEEVVCRLLMDPDVLALANRLLERLDVAVPAARSLRGDGELRFRAADGDLPGAVAGAVRDALGREGSVGVVAADGDVDRVREALRAAGIEAGGADELGARVAVVPASVVKGLEYDHVVAVEPAAIVEAEERGLHRLYVVVTRAVAGLEVVHGRPLPW